MVAQSDWQGRQDVYFSRLELAGLAALGATFVLWGLFALSRGDFQSATTAELAALSVLGIYVWYERYHRVS